MMATCWNQPALGCDELHQFKTLVAEPQAHDAHPDAEEAFEPLVLIPRHFDVEYLLERQHAREEVDRPIHVTHDHADRVGGAHRSRA